MKLIKSEKLEKSMFELEFCIDAAALEEAAAKVFKREGKKYNIPGFRKGKAPRKMIEKMYGADIFTAEAANDLFPMEFAAAAEEAGVEVVGRPEAEIVSMDAENGVVINVKVAVKPEVKVEGYKGLAVEKEVKVADDAAVDAEITRMLERNARECTREGAAQNGDIVDIDFEGFVNEVAFEGGKAEHYSLTLGSGSFIPGFEEQCVGHAAGEEFDVNVTFPEEYGAEELAGKPAVFKIKLHEVKYKELPELDDEFAKDVSEYDTLAELKESIRKGQQDQLDKQAELDLENALVDLVVEKMEAEIPQAMYETRMDELVNDFAFRVEQQGLKLEQYLGYMGQTLEQFRASFMPQAEKQVKIRLALEAVAAAEGIVATAEEYDAKINEIAEQYKMEAEQVKSLVNPEELMADLSVTKAIDFLKANAVVTEKAAAAEEVKTEE
ncbi:MAG: trigger factor [Faecalibacterium sp.]|nr:trigger factor [Faecalibacterium sp.]